MSDLIDYVADKWGDGGAIHATTDYSDDDDLRRGYNRIMNRREGRTCRYPGCDEPITNGAQVCQLHAMAWRKVKSQIKRLLARKARWAKAREAVLAEFNSGRIVGDAVRRANATR